MTTTVRAGIRDGRYLATVDTAALGDDPARNLIKTLIVQYRVSGETRSETFRECQVVYLAADEPPAKPREGFTLLEAKYGGGNSWVDVLDRLKSLVKGNVLVLPAERAASIDPLPGFRKGLFVRYVVNGEPRRVSVVGDEVLCIDARPTVVVAGPTDLLASIKPTRDAVRGAWKVKAGRLHMPAINGAQLDVPVEVPEEYELTAVVECAAQKDCFVFGLPVGGSLTAVTIDSFLRMSGFSDLDGEWLARNASLTHGRVLSVASPNKLVCRVRKGSIKVFCNNQPVLDWTGDPRRLAVNKVWGVRDPRHIFLGGYGTAWEISKLELSPLGDAANAASSTASPRANATPAARIFRSRSETLSGGDPPAVTKKTKKTKPATATVGE